MGGLTGNGTVFKITPTGEETILHLFGGYPADGQGPNSLIQGSDGNFYGTTFGGGSTNSGTVFKLTREGVETILYSFRSVPAVGPVGLIQGNDGNFYGTTANGYGGIVFKLTPEGVLTTLYTFPQGSVTDGYGPTGSLLQASDGNFYGMTEQGGTGCVTNGGCGTVFKVTPEGVQTVLHSFAGYPTDGDQPGKVTLIQGSNGNLYGTTQVYDGVSSGAVYMISRF